jgi:hypothetical protein
MSNSEGKIDIGKFLRDVIRCCSTVDIGYSFAIDVCTSTLCDLLYHRQIPQHIFENAVGMILSEDDYLDMVAREQQALSEEIYQAEHVVNVLVGLRGVLMRFGVSKEGTRSILFLLLSAMVRQTSLVSTSNVAFCIERIRDIESLKNGTSKKH